MKQHEIGKYSSHSYLSKSLKIEIFSSLSASEDHLSGENSDDDDDEEHVSNRPTNTTSKRHVI
jgi:hypothetical protein